LGAGLGRFAGNAAIVNPGGMGGGGGGIAIGGATGGGGGAVGGGGGGGGGGQNRGGVGFTNISELFDTIDDAEVGETPNPITGFR
jgi:hypothetical protein